MAHSFQNIDISLHAKNILASIKNTISSVHINQLDKMFSHIKASIVAFDSPPLQPYSLRGDMISEKQELKQEYIQDCHYLLDTDVSIFPSCLTQFDIDRMESLQDKTVSVPNKIEAIQETTESVKDVTRSGVSSSNFVHDSLSNDNDMKNVVLPNFILPPNNIIRDDRSTLLHLASATGDFLQVQNLLYDSENQSNINLIHHKDTNGWISLHEVIHP